MAYIDLDRLREVLLDAILKRQSVQALFDRVYDCIKLPLIAFDVSFGVIAYAFPRPFYFLHWENMVSQGQAPEDVVIGYNYLEYQQLIYSAGKSVLCNWGTCAGYDQVDAPIMQDENLIGYVGILLEGTDVETALEANDMLAKVIPLLMGKAPHASPDKSPYESALLQSGMSTEFAESFAERYHSPYVFVILSTRDPGVSTLEYVRSVLCVEYNSVIGCLNSENYLYMLYYNVDTSTYMPNIRSSLENVALKHSVICGVSDYLSDPLHIADSRMQAMLSLSVGDERKPGERVFMFQENYTEIIYHCALEKFGAPVCMLKDINSLVIADKNGRNGYLETLEAYLNNFRRYSATAAELKLHKNTVLNRIQRIKEILGIDIDDSDCADRLSIGIDMYRTIERTFPGSGKEVV